MDIGIESFEICPPHIEKKILAKLKVLDLNFRKVLAEESSPKEVAHIQPLILAFCQSLYSAILSNRKGHLVISTDKDSISYSTRIPLSESTTVVSGEVDIAIMYRNVCVALWEVRNTTENLDCVGHKTQVLAELQGKREKFVQQMGRQPPALTGFLTNGLFWSSYHSTVVEGISLLSRSPPIPLSDGKGVCTMLYHSAMAIERMIRAVNSVLYVIGAPSTIVDADEDPDIHDNPDADNFPPDILDEFSSFGFSSSAGAGASNRFGGSSLTSSFKKRASLPGSTNYCTITNENLNIHNNFEKRKPSGLLSLRL